MRLAGMSSPTEYDAIPQACSGDEVSMGTLVAFQASALCKRMQSVSATRVFDNAQYLLSPCPSLEYTGAWETCQRACIACQHRGDEYRGRVDRKNIIRHTCSYPRMQKIRIIPPCSPTHVGIIPQTKFSRRRLGLDLCPLGGCWHRGRKSVEKMATRHNHHDISTNTSPSHFPW